MNLILRELTKEDVKSMIAIRLELLENHPLNFGSSVEEEKQFTTEKWLNRLTNPNTITIGSFLDGTMIGLAVLSMNPRKKMKHLGVINSFYVSESYRRKGIASKLLNFVEDIARNHKILRLNLTVMDQNKAAIQLYKKHGFIETGKELESIYVDQKYYSLLMMSKRLDDVSSSRI